MKYYRINAYVNHGAIPSNEFAQNIDDRQCAYDIETEKTLQVVDEVDRQLKRSMWLLERKPKSGSRNSVYGFGWRANGSSMDMLQQFEYVETAAHHDDWALVN